MDRKKKEQVVNDLNQSFKESKAVFVTDFKGIDVEAITILRGKIRASGADYCVAKNTLVKIAAKDTNVMKLEAMLVGNNALGLTTGDPAALAKVLCDFAKENDKFVVKGGLLDDKLMADVDIKALASLPSREVLLSTLLGTMQAVPTSLVRVLAAVPQNFVYALAAIRDQKEAA